MTRRDLRSLLVCVLLVGTLAAVGVGAATQPADRSSAIDAGTEQVESDGPTIEIRTEYRLTPDRPGHVEVQWRFEVPENVVRLNTSLFPEASKPVADGFERQPDGTYVWREAEQSTRTPTLTFSVAVNRTERRVGPIGTGGRFTFVDAGEWALFRQRPSPSIGYSYRDGTENPATEWTSGTGGPGVVGSSMVFLGPHESVRRDAHGQTFRLVVPDAATLDEERADVFASVTDAADRLRVGDRDESVLMIAAPRSVPWAVRGIQTGDRDFYVVANETVDRPDNVWVHEYVHTRQSFRNTDATAWFYEGGAEYYAALATLEQDRIDFEAFQRYLGRGASWRYDDVTLADPASWHDGAEYLKGGLVVGTLDRRLRLATDSRETFQSVFQGINRDADAVTQDEFLALVGSAGGDGARDIARRYTATTAGPSVWSGREHQRAFGSLPARFSYTFPESGSDGLRVAGPYRNGTVGDVELVRGERLVADVGVANVGGTAGTYDLLVTREGDPVAARSGDLDAGANATETVGVAFPGPGTYRLSTGEDALTVRVREPAALSVTGLSANRTTVEAGGTVRLTATVENQFARPGAATVTIRRGESELESERVRLAGNAATTVTATATLDEAGTYEFTAGNVSTTVSVGGDGTTDGSNGTPGAGGPGFGVLVALAALGLASLLARRVE
ncbi:MULTISPECIES: PGF-CTERM sorting domain-containing protein [Salinibaculum]|uniref:PGF-CTERM sorting domain-containing protein n=1 Tax=Salinibaculum TaxID=2732368 RepID=UPI0030CA9083